MSDQLTVWASEPTQQAGAVASVIASLPVSFTPAGPESEVRAILGIPGWASEALTAVGDGVKGLVIVSPSAEDVAPLERAAEAAGVPIVIDSRWAANPALAGTDAPVREVLAQAVLLDSVATATFDTDLESLLAEHLAVALRFAGELYDLRILHRSRHGYTASGRLPDGAPVSLQGIITGSRSPGTSLNLLTAGGGVGITIPDSNAAWPAEARVVTTNGATLLPTIYESAHRATWRRLRDHLAAPSSARDLAGFSRLTASLGQLS